MNIAQIKKHFPSLSDGKVIYFDSASTTQKPINVINSVNNYLYTFCANAGRGQYRWARAVDQEVLEVRKKVAKFIGAESEENIMFTSGATESANNICYGWGLEALSDGDKIVIGENEHLSTIAPWMNLQHQLDVFGKKINLEKISNSFAGDYSIDSVKNMSFFDVKLINLTHIHNIFGMNMGIEKIVELIPDHVFISIDASQSVGHIPVDVKKLKADFLYFSGHKMFAYPGIGILYMSDRALKMMKSYKVGGGLKSEYREAGSLNIPGVISLGAAIDFINNVGLEKIENYIATLTDYLISKLSMFEDISFLKGPAVCKCKSGCGIVTFIIRNLDSHAVGMLLDDCNIFVRTGDHCNSDVEEDSIRISLHIYNTQEEIDLLIDKLEKIFKGGKII